MVEIRDEVIFETTTWSQGFEFLDEQEKMPYITSVERIGRREGRQEGEAAVLLRLITLKFGPPSESVRQRVQAADAETLLDWSERVLTAQRLDEVLR